MSPSPEAQKMEEILRYTEGGEGSAAVNRRPQRPRRGQGVRGLYRSWRTEMWGIVGIWGSGVLGTLLGAGDEEIGASAAMGGSGVRF